MGYIRMKTSEKFLFSPNFHGHFKAKCWHYPKVLPRTSNVIGKSQNETLKVFVKGSRLQKRVHGWSPKISSRVIQPIHTPTQGATAH